MNGMELSKAFYTEIGEPMLREPLPWREPMRRSRVSSKAFGAVTVPRWAAQDTVCCALRSS